MRCISRWDRVVVAAVAALSAVGAAQAGAEIFSDRATAIVTWPLLRSFEADLPPGTPIDIDGIPGIVVESRFIEDTVIQLSNTSRTPITAHCFYENANSHCSDSGAVCLRGIDCCNPSTNGCGICEPGWNELDFHVRLTPRQPLGWRLSEGLSEFPHAGNSGSRIPPIPETPFLGALKCIAIDQVTGAPVARNDLKGEATIEFVVDIEVIIDDIASAPAQVRFDGIDFEVRPGGGGVGLDGGPTGEGGGTGPAPEPTERFLFTDVAKYNAVGIPAVPDGVNDDDVLMLGGPQAEYGSCPNVLIVNHLFDGVFNPVSGLQSETRVALLPCTQDLLQQIPGSAVVQYLVFNEFEQRFSTSRSVDCLQYLPLSLIDTTQQNRSIFSAGVAGTVSGQSRLQPIGDGLVAVALEGYGFVTFTEDGVLLLDRPAFSAAFNVHFQGDREEADIITLP